MTQIYVQYRSLDDYARAFRNLSGYLEDRRFVTTELLNESEGETCSALNETYEILCGTEQVLQQLMRDTADWLEMAKERFEGAEKQSISDTDQALGT